MREVSVMLIFFNTSIIHLTVCANLACELTNLIFGGRSTLVQHFIDDSSALGGFAKCVENDREDDPAFYSFTGNFDAVKQIQFDENRIGVVLWPSSSEQVTVERLISISLNYYSWMTLICHFFNVTDFPPISWIARCCDAVLMVEGFLEVDDDHVVYDDTQKYQQILIFSTGILDVACNRCGLIHSIVDLKAAVVEPMAFNKTLICASRSMRMYFTVNFSDDAEPRTGNATGGFEFMLMEDIRNHLGFRYSVQESFDSRSWGGMKNGTWKGILSQIVERRAHFAIGDLTIFHPRNLYFDFTYPHDFDVLAFVSKPEVRTLSSTVFIKLMDEGCWLSLLFLTLITCTLLAVSRSVNGTRAPCCWVILRGTEFIFGALVQPSVEFPYKTRPVVRILLLLWTAGLFILSTALSASLVMFIASPGFDRIIDTMEDCVEFVISQKDPRICMEPGNYLNFFDRSNPVISPEAARISSYVYHECWNWSDSWIVNEVLRGANFLWLSEKAQLTAEFIAEASREGVLATTHVSRDHLSIMHQGIVTQRGCAFSLALQNVSRTLFETGHLIHYKKILNIFELPPLVTEHSFVPLSLSSMSGFVTSVLILEAATVSVLVIEMSLTARMRLQFSSQ